MIYRDFRDIKLSALCPGCMRLPVIGGDDSVIDVPTKFPGCASEHRAHVAEIFPEQLCKLQVE